jgi:hypothetical protein
MDMFPKYSVKRKKTKKQKKLRYRMIHIKYTTRGVKNQYKYVYA